MLGLAAPVVGGVAAWLIALAAGQTYSISEYEAVVLGAWLVTGPRRLGQRSDSSTACGPGSR